MNIPIYRMLTDPGINSNFSPRCYIRKELVSLRHSDPYLTDWLDISLYNRIGCINFHNATNWDTSRVTYLCNLNQYLWEPVYYINGGVMKHWDVSAVQSMYSTFQFLNIYNSDFSKWNTESLQSIIHAMYFGVTDDNFISMKNFNMRNLKKKYI